MASKAGTSRNNELPIRLDGVWKELGHEQVLKNVSFAVKPGEICSLIGPNGAGKTTTVRLILGLLFASAGTVSIWGVDPYRDKSFAHRLGVVLEQTLLWEKYCGLENIAMYCRIWNLSKEMYMRRVNDLDTFLHIGHVLSRPVYTYSKGMKRKLSLLITLLKNPDLLVCDELSSGIDPKSRVDMRKLLFELRKQGKTILYTSHDLEEVQKLSDKIFLINKGRLILANDRDQIRKSRIRVTAEVGEDVYPQLLPLLKENGVAFTHQGNKLQVETEKRGLAEAISRRLVQAGGNLKEIVEDEDSLEAMFMKLLREEEGK